MGPCTSTSKNYKNNTRIAIPKEEKSIEQPASLIHKAPTEATQNLSKMGENSHDHSSLKTPITLDEKTIPPTVISRKLNQDNGENFILDETLHLTLVSQKCLKNVQDTKFLSHVRNSRERFGSKDSSEGRKESLNEHDEMKESMNKSLVCKRPEFQKKVEKKKIELKVDLKKRKSPI